MAATENCPFCNASVEKDLVVFGGSCPSCFGEIPGEEAATDPGEDVKRKQEANDAKRLRRRMFVPALLASMVVMGIFATALALILWPEPQMAMLDLDDDQYADFEFKFDAEEMPEEVVEDPKAGNAAVKKLRGGSDSSKKVDKKAKSLQDLKNFKLGSVADIPSGDIAAGSGPEVGGPRGPRGSQAGDITDVAVPTNLGGGSASGGDLFGGGSSSFSGGATISRREAMGVTLQDDNAIIGMVQRVMRAELRKIKTCYTQQLKVDENLQGQWVLMFTVGSDGKTKDISVSAKQKTNADLESCMSTKVTGWQFQPIKADLPVKKTVTFKPSY